MPLMTVRLELARDKDFPQGSSDHGYEFIAPLAQDGHIDVGEWRKKKDRCTVRRFWADEDDEYGHLLHTRGRTFKFHYDLTGDPNDDETGYRFDSHAFLPGEYVSIREHDDELRTFRVVAATPAP